MGTHISLNIRLRHPYLKPWKIDFENHCNISASLHDFEQFERQCDYDGDICGLAIFFIHIRYSQPLPLERAMVVTYVNIYLRNFFFSYHERLCLDLFFYFLVMLHNVDQLAFITMLSLSFFSTLYMMLTKGSRLFLLFLLLTLT